MTFSMKHVFSRTARLRVLLACTTAATGLAAPATSRAEIATGTALRVELSPRTVARTERAAVRGERFASGPNETFEILLSDGGSIVLGPSSAVLVSDYTFDPVSGAGRFSARLEAGSVRMMGGRLNRAAPMELTAPGGRLSLANGGAFVTLEDGGARASLLAGTLAVAADRGEVRLEKPGFETSIVNGSASAPRRQNRGQAFADAVVINPGLRTGGMAQLVKVVESDIDSEAEQTPETDTQLVRSEVAVNQPTGSLDFGGPGRTITLPGGGTIAIGGASTGTVPTQGNPVLGDVAEDLLLAQDRPVEYPDPPCDDTCFRKIGSASNRLLDSAKFEYSLSDAIPSALAQKPDPSQGSSSDLEKLSYIFSTGLTPTDGQFFKIKINETQLVESSDRSFVTFMNDRYEDSSGSGIFKNSEGKEILYDGSIYYIESPGLSSQNLLILTAHPERALLTDAGAGGSALILPILGFPADGSISIKDYSGPVFAKRVDDSLEFYDVDPNDLPKSYEDYQNYISNAASIGDIDVQIGLFQSGFGAASARSGPSGDRAPNNFLYLEQTSPSDNSVLVFAAGDVSQTSTRLSTTASVDSFALTRGLNTADLTADTKFRDADAPLAFRAFLPEASLPAGIAATALQSTPLYVANPAASTVSRLFQADFGLSENRSASTISVTLGRVTYTDGGSDGTLGDRAEVAVAGHTIGSTHSGSTSTQAISSPLIASSSGGNEANPGYASYLVLENVGEDEGAGSSGGTIDPLVGASSQYGFLRLATRDETTARGTIPVAANTGYVAGLVETAGGGRLALGQVTSLSVNGADNTVDARLSLDGSNYQLGGSTGESAYVDKANFAAATAPAATTSGAALVSGEGVVGASDAFKNVRTSYQHVQWGFFFGDLSTGTASDPQRHTALSSWAAGERWTGGPIQTLSGRATYSGLAIGSVLYNQTSRVDVGSFDQTWDFSGHKYTMELRFPEPTGTDRNLTYALSLTPGTGASYSGLSNLVDTVQASVTGQLVGNGAALPQGTIGQFQLLNVAGNYSAVGTFAGDTGR